jgi:hypothetical protein
MPYTVVLDFKKGMDRRRPLSATDQGSIYTIKDAHITRGGDIEQRKAFVPKYSLPAGTFGLAKAGSELYVFGSGAEPVGMPADVNYQRLEHPDGLAMTAVLDTDLFGGKIYAIAKYSDDSIHHFYDGERVTDWDDGIVRAAMTDNDGIAEHLRALIDADPAYTATRVGSTITIAAAVAGVPFDISAETQNVEGGTDDQSITLNETVANVTGEPETLAEGSFRIIAGTASAGVNKISSVKVDGVEILNTAVDWTTSHSTTAVAVANQINSHNSTPEYTAVADGPVVRISPAAGTGDGPNGFVVEVAADGDVEVDSIQNMSGGVDASGNTAQEVEAVIAGTFEVGDKFSITIDDKVFGFSDNPSQKGTICLTHEDKVYALCGSLLQFSGIRAPTGWNTKADVGAGFIPMSNHDAGSEVLTGLEIYQNNMTVFARRVIQIWNMNADPSLNIKLQVVKNTGSRAPKSIKAVGDFDVFYYSDSGIRSLRARDSSNTASVNDVGTLIDPFVQEHELTLTEDEIAAAVAVIEPIDGRYWLAIGDKIIVLTHFPASKISAWSYYEPGFTISDLVDVGRKVYARSGDTIYLYGGDDGQTYDATLPEVQLPFITADRPATGKEVVGFDMDCSGTWDVKILVDPRDVNRWVRIGEISGFTYNDANQAGIGGTTHFAPKLVGVGSGRKVISSIAVHFQGEEEESN